MPKIKESLRSISFLKSTEYQNFSSFYLRIEFPAHPSDVALICKTVVAVVTDDNMFMNGDAHHLT